jgi:hypothetical protein
MNSAAAITEFDVSAQNLNYYRNRRIGRWIGLILAAGLSLFLFYGISRAIDQVSSGTSLSSIQLAVFVALVLTVGPTIVVLMWGVITMGPGAERIRISSAGIELKGPRSSLKSFEWRSPRLSFDLRDWSDQPVVAGTGNPYYLAIPGGRTHALSKEAFESILEDARDRRLVTRVYKGNATWYGAPPTIYRIRGPPNDRSSNSIAPRNKSTSS